MGVSSVTGSFSLPDGGMAAECQYKEQGLLSVLCEGVLRTAPCVQKMNNDRSAEKVRGSFRAGYCRKDHCPPYNPGPKIFPASTIGTENGGWT